MFTSLRHLRVVLVNFIIITLVYAPALSSSQFGRSSQFAVNSIRSNTANRELLAANFLAPHAEHRLLLKFRDEASLEDRSSIIESYGEPELQPRRVGESVITLKLKENVSTALAELQRMDKVIEWVEPDYVVGGRMSVSGGRKEKFAGEEVRSSQRRQFAARLRTANFPAANSLTAIVDTGLSGKYPSGWNFLNDSDSFSDDNGHGTEMARIITEVNPKVSLMPLKALDANGIGTVSKIAAAIDYATNNHAGVILHSFGTSEPSRLVEEAIKRAEMAGVVIIAAAGNDGVDLEKTPQYPAASKASNLITVAATTKNHELAEYSNFGKGVHVAASGEGANQLRGTSMAAARVAGIASLLKAERPWVSAGTIKNALMKSAKRYKSLNVESGAVDAKAAVAEFQDKKPDDKTKDENGVPKEPKKVNRQLEARRQKLKDEEKEKEAKHPYHDADLPRDASYDLDHTRDDKPREPEGVVRANALQPAGYHDPVPTSTANYSSYFTEMSKAANDIGMAGSKPMQMVDPTAGTSVIGGMSINLGSKNLNFTAPALSLGGRAGMNLSLGLTYNSQVWVKNPATNTMVYNADRGNVAPGWRIGFGAMQGINASGQVGPYSNSITGKQSFLYLQPDGTRRDLAYNATTLKYESYDSSYLQFDATTKILRTTSGSQIKFNVSATAAGEYQLLPTEIKDRNGNFISVVYKLLTNNDTVIDYITDTLGRRIDFYYVSNKLKEIRQDRNGTIFKYLVIDYTAVTLTNGFTSTEGYWNYVYDPDTGDLISQTWVPPTMFSLDASSMTAYLPTRLTYPTGTNLRMYYTSYGQIHKFEKWVPTIAGQGTERMIAVTQLVLPGSGNSTPATSAWSYGTVAPVTDYCPYFKHRGENTENWMNNNPNLWGAGAIYNYGYGANSGGVTEPLAGQPLGTSHNIVNNGLVQTTTVSGSGLDYYGNVVYVTLKTIVNTFTKDTGVTYNSNLRPIESRITDQSSHTRKVGLSYIQQDGLWLVNNKDDYDAAGTAVYRRTTMTYTSYPAQRILGLPLTTATYAGAGTTLLAKTENVYDETASYSDSGGGTNPYFANAGTTVQHDDANYGAGFTTRGNLTTVKQYATNNSTVRIIGRTGYDTNGNVRNAADAANNRKTIDYTDYFTNKPATLGSLQAYVKTTADPVNLKAGAQYNYYTGLPVKSFIINPSLGSEEQITTMTYDFADRPVQTTKPNGSWASVSYWDNLLRQTTNTKHDVVGSVDQIVASFQDFDGAGRTLRKGSDHPNAIAGKYSGQKFKYDELGRGVEQSQILMVDSSFNPDPAETGQGGWNFTKASFDGMNRTTSVQKPDNTYIFSDYSVCGCAGGLVNTTYDERDNQKVTESDFLGRLKYAREFEPITAYDENLQITYIDHYELRAQVEYIYDNLDRFVTINHTGTPSWQGNGPAQVRSFTYDTWGRLASETTPEAGTVSYTYTANDQVATTTNARGVTTTVAYNNRNLVTGVTYSDPTPASTYAYDNYGARTAMTDGEGSMSYAYNSYRQLDYETRVFTGLTGKSYKLSYSYGLGGQLKQSNYAALNTTVQNTEPEKSPLANQIAANSPQLKMAESTPESKSSLGLKLPDFTNKLRGSLNHSTRLMPMMNLAVASASGTIRRAAAYGGQPIPGVTVSASYKRTGVWGSIPISTTTDANGYYSLSANATSFSSFGVYKAGWNLAYVSGPPGATDYEGTPTNPTTTISGTITTRVTGTPVSGATVTLTGATTYTTTTDANGNYSATVNTAGPYSVTPSKAGYNFTPMNGTVAEAVVPQTMNFQATPITQANTPPSGNTLFSQNVNYAYKKSGALESIGTSMIGGDALSKTNVIDSLSYRAFGSASQVVYGNDRKLDLGYYAGLNRLSGMALTRWDGSDAIVATGYTYTENGLISYISDPDYINHKKFVYNYRNQLTTVYSNYQGASFSTTNYSFDDFGNLLNGMAWNGNGTNRPISYTSGGTTTNFTYDNSGNMTAAGATTYQWDGANRLKSVNGGTSGSYGFDGNGKRVKKTEGGASTYYVYSSVIGSAVMEVASAGVQRAYVMNGGGVVAQRNPDGNFYWLHADHLGSGRKMTNTSGNLTYRAEFDPYGKLLYEWSATPNLNTKKFTGYERDAGSGLDYAQARMYGSEWGRFMSPDPMGFASANKLSPKTLNRYTYTGGDPVNRIDPTGMFDSPPGWWNLPSSYLFMMGIWTNSNYTPTFIDSYFANLMIEINIGLNLLVQAQKQTQIIKKMADTTDKDYDKAVDFVKDNPDCVPAFEAANGGQSFQDAVDKIKIYDTSDIADSDKDFWNSKPSDIGDSGSARNATFNSLIGPQGIGNAIALWTGLTPMIIVGQNTAGRDRGQLIVHEMLHIFFKGNHVDVATKLGLKFEAGNDSAAKNAINDFLHGGCQKK